MEQRANFKAENAGRMVNRSSGTNWLEPRAVRIELRNSTAQKHGGVDGKLQVRFLEENHLIFSFV